MRKRRVSISTRISIISVIIILAVVAISSVTTGILFYQNSLAKFYESSSVALSEFSDSITMFFNAKEVELNVFAESEVVKAADDTIHSFVDEKGEIQILGYRKSPTEEAIRKLCKIFAKHDTNIAEIYIGTKWGGYATNFDSSMNGGYDPRKRGWYETANKGKGRVMITDAFASTVGATVVGITRCAYNDKGDFIGNASIEVSLDTLTKILETINLGDGSFLMMIQKDGTILADTSPAKNNFKNISEINMPELMPFLTSGQTSGTVTVEGKTYFTEFTTNEKTGYQIVAFSPTEIIFAAYYKTLSITVIICAIFAIIVAAVTAIIAGKTMRPLHVIGNTISDTAEQIVEGRADLSKRIDIKADNEIGDVAEGFNVFYEKLSEIIKSMKQSKRALTSAGDSLKNGTSDASEAITQITGSISNLKGNIAAQNTSVEHTTRAIGGIIEHIHSLDTLVGTQVTVVQTASTAVEQMIGNIGEVNTSIDKMAMSFGTLAHTAESGAATQNKLKEQIGEIEMQSKLLNEANSVIANIAEQTNLLAMNAAIEAAHAGEAGKGFAVVADEIRKLSETSTSQSKTIGDQLKRIQGAIETVVNATQQGVKDYTNLASEIRETDVLVQHIKAAMSEQREGSAQITGALHNMKTSTAEVREASKDMTEGSSAIMGEVGTLQHETEAMKFSMEEMIHGAGKIERIGTSLSEISALMENSIGEIGKQVDQFEA
ncbi:MAG: HAMP domain-containing protein [Spirochaetaceae bacterium]|nr:HAMP domain-containing protein [Spirochaetaceae bacterium]